jgi:hypothetical protein
LLRARSRLLKRTQELFPPRKGEGQLHAVPRRFMLRCGPAVFHRSARRRCGHTAVDRFIQANALPRLECVRHHPSRTGGLTIRVDLWLRVPVHIRWQLSRNAIVSRQSRIAEIQLSHAFGTSEISERNSGTETIYGTRIISGTETICGARTISGIETIICAVTGKNTFSLTPQGIGIAIGTAIATIGGMVTDAPLLTERG